MWPQSVFFALCSKIIQNLDQYNKTVENHFIIKLWNTFCQRHILAITRQYPYLHETIPLSQSTTLHAQDTDPPPRHIPAIATVSALLTIFWPGFSWCQRWIRPYFPAAVTVVRVYIFVHLVANIYTLCICV